MVGVDDGADAIWCLLRWLSRRGEFISFRSLFRFSLLFFRRRRRRTKMYFIFYASGVSWARATPIYTFTHTHIYGGRTCWLRICTSIETIYTCRKKRKPKAILNWELNNGTEKKPYIYLVLNILGDEQINYKWFEETTRRPPRKEQYKNYNEGKSKFFLFVGSFVYMQTIMWNRWECAAATSDEHKNRESFLIAACAYKKDCGWWWIWWELGSLCDEL